MSWVPLSPVDRASSVADVTHKSFKLRLKEVFSLKLLVRLFGLPWETKLPDVEAPTQEAMCSHVQEFYLLSMSTTAPAWFLGKLKTNRT